MKKITAGRIARVVRELKERRARKITKKEKGGDFRHMTKPMRRKETPPIERVRAKLKTLIAYDLETTNIAVGTPRPLYLTAKGADFWYSGEVLGSNHLREILTTRFLTPETAGCAFVAWNGNKFDVYLVSLALMKAPEFLIKPYLTQSKNLRGLRVILRQYKDGVEITGNKGVKQVSWEFLDGMAMLGILKRLKSKTDKKTGIKETGFLHTFAPEYDWEEAPDFDGGEQFNPRNPDHIRYAERDSEGLYHGMEKAREIVLEHFSIDLSPTIGNMGIKIFQRNMPKMIECWQPPAPALKAIRNQVMRGGFCFCVSRYSGPVWKYDINQAYAAAMREAYLPAGRCVWSASIHPYARTYIARIKAHNYKNRVPFYYRDMGLGRSVFGLQDIGETWLTSIEIEQLKREGWEIEVFECWFWQSAFKMTEYVNKLEFLRVGEGRDPKTALGEMCKYIGCNSYGKTVEQLSGLDLMMSAEQPEGFSPYPVEDEKGEPGMEYVWYKIGTPMLREYHQPQIGAFITAHPRMVVRRAALSSPDTWLYADTDCTMFRAPAKLDFDPKRYGAWKIEAENVDYTIIAKKVYTSHDGRTRHAKGLNVAKLTGADFERWLAGTSPRQTQLQRQNFVKVLAGFDMFRERRKWGEQNENSRAVEQQEKEALRGNERRA